MADLSGLSPAEYEQISRVLQRDQELRKAEEARVRQLKQELLCLRKRAALRPGLDPQKSCSRCLCELGRLTNRGALCPLCRKKVCKGCRQFAGAGSDWRCTYCYKQMQLKAVSGQWMLEFGRLSAYAGDEMATHPHHKVGLPVRTFPLSYELPPEKSPNLFRSDPYPLDEDTGVDVDKKNNVPSSAEENEARKNNISSPKVCPRVSPWADIDPEPTFPLRIVETASVGVFQPCESQGPLTFRDCQSSDEDHKFLDFRSRSRSSDVVLDTQSPNPTLLPRQALQKQVAIPNPVSEDPQHCCPQTADSGRSSPVLKPNFLFGANPEVIVSSGQDSPSFPRYLESESSLSETDDECQLPKSTFPLQRQQSEEKYSADESGNSLRSSPHGRLRMRNRSLSGGSEDGRQRKASVPQLCVSECFESPIGRLNNGMSDKDNSASQDEDPDQPVPYHSRSQMSLSSFGGRSESINSVYSAAGGGRYGTVIVTGDVLFGISYNYKLGALEINIKECRNLAAVDTKRNRSDPYVKVYLLPDRTKSGKRKTKVKKHTLNPVFDEILKFHVTVSELEIRTLWLSVWHSDRFGRNDFLGEAMLPLGNDIFENSGLKWYPLQERLETVDASLSYKGDLILALKYVPPDVTSRKFSKKPGTPAKGALEILVREARNLMATRSNETSDPFCKSYLLPDKSKTGKQKTPVFKKSCNPKWNHTFVYDNVSLDDLQERCLELTIWDYDKITSNDFLGGVRLCLGSGKYKGKDVDWMDSVGEERLLWHTMLERPNTWVDGSLLLRHSMQSRRTVT